MNQGDYFGGSTRCVNTGAALVKQAVLLTDAAQAAAAPCLAYSWHAHLVSPGATIYVAVFDSNVLIGDGALSAGNAAKLRHWYAMPTTAFDWIFSRSQPGEPFFLGFTIQLSTADFPTVTTPGSASLWAALNYGDFRG